MRVARGYLPEGVNFPPQLRDKIRAEMECGMYCYANNLPVEAERKPAEDAVVLGVGDRAEDVEHYSIVAAQNTSVLQIQIKLKGSNEPLYVDLAHHTPEGISRGVAAALVGR